jgi:IS30 family transposase
MKITIKERREIEKQYNNGETVMNISVRLGICRSAVYRELRRGDTGEMDQNGRRGYSADIAQKNTYDKWSKCRKLA